MFSGTLPCHEPQNSLALVAAFRRSASFAHDCENAFSVYTLMDAALWQSDPETAYGEWQRAEATGAERRIFAERSIVQHCSMFARFHRYPLRSDNLL